MALNRKSKVQLINILRNINYDFKNHGISKIKF